MFIFNAITFASSIHIHDKKKHLFLSLSAFPSLFAFPSLRTLPNRFIVVITIMWCIFCAKRINIFPIYFIWSLSTLWLLILLLFTISDWFCCTKSSWKHFQTINGVRWRGWNIWKRRNGWFYFAQPKGVKKRTRSFYLIFDSRFFFFFFVATNAFAVGCRCIENSGV